MRSRWRALRTVGSVAVVCGACWLSACSTVPSSGPSRQAVLDSGTQVDAPYLLVNLSDFVIQQLAHSPAPSLYGRFGDYRASVEQKIGVGDTVVVTIFEAAGGGLFSQPVPSATSTGSHSASLPPQVVQRDGSITVPYAGRVRVVGETPQAVEKTIVDRLTGKAIEPQAVVTLLGNVASSVTLTGEGVQGDRVPLSARGDRLLDVIATAGGIRTKASETFLELTRGGRTVRVPFQTLLNDTRENIFARPGDVLTVVKYPLTFTAVGATSLSGVVPFDAVGISLEEAVGKVAGLDDSRADPEGVFVFRYESADVVRNYPGLTPAQASLNLVPVVYLINMRDPRSLFLARRFSIHDKDIVYVSNSPFSDISKVVGLVQTLTSPAITGVGVAQTVAGSANSATASALSSSAATTAAASAAAGAVSR